MKKENESEKENVKETGVERGTLRSGDMDHKDGGSEKTGGV